MEMTTEKAMQAHIEMVLPRTCRAMADRLAAWLNVALKDHQESAILNQDGTMNDELFSLITLARVYFELAGSSRESWQNLCLLEARRTVLAAVLETVTRVQKRPAKVEVK